jgi:uncharacterized protein YcaQ
MKLDDLRRFAATQSLPPPASLPRALADLAYVQADPIRAPARAQDLVLRHRVEGYRAGDLERRYEELDVAEDFFVNYGFVTRALQALMHPRPNLGVPAGGAEPWPAEKLRRARRVHAFVRERGVVHPREVDARFEHGTVTNYWGGSSNATTQLLDAMHYRGLLRVARRERGVRLYAVHEHPGGRLTEAERGARLDALIDVLVRLYAPLPATSLAQYVRRLRYAAPQWRAEIAGALRRAKERLAHARVEGIEWYWAEGDDAKRRDAARSEEREEQVRLLTPFDPVVQDRARFEVLWGWVYRFEAYTPVKQRKLGYYALPLLWRDRVIGWGNLTWKDGVLGTQLGFVAGKAPRERAFAREMEAEVERVREFLRER